MNDTVTERRAEPGELCTCGRQATVVFLGGQYGPTGYCGIGDGGAQNGPCPFCGSEQKHRTSYGDPSRCPNYQLRPERRTP